MNVRYNYIGLVGFVKCTNMVSVCYRVSFHHRSFSTFKYIELMRL